MPDRNHCQSVVFEGVAERNGKCAEVRQHHSVVVESCSLTQALNAFTLFKNREGAATRKIKTTSKGAPPAELIALDTEKQSLPSE
jgi:hypothetical protein